MTGGLVNGNNYNWNDNDVNVGTDNDSVFPRFFMLNATSLAKPKAKEHLSTDIENVKSDIILIEETWFTRKLDSANLQINGYTLYRRDRRDGRKGGGVCIYARDSYKCTVLNPDIFGETNAHIEVLWLHCVTDHCSCIICLCYHPPNPLYNCSQIIHHITSGIEHLQSSYPNDFMLVAGDFNALNTDFISTDLGFYQLVKEHTHMNHIIDKVFVSRPGLYNHCYTMRSIVKTKHRAVIFTVDHGTSSQSDRHKSKTKCIVYDKRQPNIDRLRHHLGTYDWSSLYNGHSIDEMYTIFIEVVNTAINTCIPSKTVTLRPTEPYYITPYVKSLLIKRSKLRRRGRTTEADELAVKINDLINQAQLSKLSKLSASNPAELWKYVRATTGDQKSVGTGEAASKFLSSPNLVNEFFAKISTDNNYSIKNVLNVLNANTPYDDISEVIEPFQPYFVENLLRRLKHTSPGFDAVPSWLFKSCSFEIAEIVTFLINTSLASGSIPNNWRTAIVTPIQKKSCPQSLSDFRPISVTPILSRVTEKLVVSKWLRPSLISSSIEDQFAFRQTGSTSCALIKLIDCISSSFEHGNNSVQGLMVDFSKAFDTVDHAILVAKLHQLTLPYCIKQWIVSFLINRSQIVKIDGQHSPAVSINRGIVQGSALGPYLFILMISDLKPLGNDTFYVKYADDLTVVVPEHSKVTVAQERHHILSWAIDNKLIVNEQKTFDTTFYKRIAPPITDNSNVSNNNNNRPIVDFKLLGVNIDNRLNFVNHVNSLITVCSQRFYILKVLKNQGMSKQNLHIIYNSIVINRILYCLSVWGGYVRTCDIDRFNSLFRRAKKYGYTHVTYDFIGLLYTSDSRLFTKIQSPSHCLNYMLPPKSSSLSLRKRGHDFLLPVAKSEHYKKSFLPRILYSFI